MKGKKDHDSDEEVEEVDMTQDEILPQQVSQEDPDSASNNEAQHRQFRSLQQEQLRYSMMEDPEEGVLFEEQSEEVECKF
jgi:hypothetical protein